MSNAEDLYTDSDGNLWCTTKDSSCVLFATVTKMPQGGWVLSPNEKVTRTETFVAPSSYPAVIAAKAEANRLRVAMQAMANVMRCVFVAFHWKRDLVTELSNVGRGADIGQPLVLCDPSNSVADHEVMKLASREWSAEVRRKVAALPKPGPRVYCTSEED